MIKRVFITIMRDNHGSGLVVVLLILAAITVIGISALNTSNVEVLLANNDMIYKRNVYRTEAATREGARALEIRTSDDLVYPIRYGKTTSNAKFTMPEWLNIQGSNSRLHYTDKSIWDSNCTSDCIELFQSSIDSSAYYAIVYNRVAPDQSLDATAQTFLLEFSVYGFSKENGAALIEIGYRRRL